MAGFAGHLTGGILAFVGLAVLLSSQYGIIGNYLFIKLAVITILFSIFPDIDTKSKPQKIFYMAFLIVGVLMFALKLYYYATLFLMMILMPLLGKHRGFLHSKLAMLLFPLPLLLYPLLLQQPILRINAYYYLAGVSGYFIHLLLDGELL